MTATIQIFVLLLAVLAAVAVLARRLGTAPSILLVIAGIVLALIPGLPRVQLAPEFVLLVLLPPIIYSAGRFDELARVPLQPAADRAAGLRLRGVHDLRGRGQPSTGCSVGRGR